MGSGGRVQSFGALWAGWGRGVEGTAELWGATTHTPGWSGRLTVDARC